MDRSQSPAAQELVERARAKDANAFEELVERALEGLSADHRQVMVLARLEELDVQEIAARMERTPNAVKKLLAGHSSSSSAISARRPCGAPRFTFRWETAGTPWRGRGNWTGRPSGNACGPIFS